MSLNCEPTELTPLRRSNCSGRQQHYTPEQIENSGGGDDDDDDDGGGDHNNRNHELCFGNSSSNRYKVTIASAPSDSALELDHLQSPAFSEYMSINRNNNNNHLPPAVSGSDSSRADTSEPNSQQALNPKTNNMSDTKRIITRVTIDFIVLLSGESLLHFSSSPLKFI